MLKFGKGKPNFHSCTPINGKWTTWNKSLQKLVKTKQVNKQANKHVKNRKKLANAG